MITPSFGLTSTERVLPKLALDFTTASLDSRVTFTRTTGSSNPATYVNSSGVITAATNNQPRFDYDPVTLACKGLLIEESRVNYAVDSSTFTSWTLENSSVPSAVQTAPDGSSNSIKLTENTATGAHGVYFSVAVSSVVYSASIFLKAAERTKASLFIFNVSPAAAYEVQVDLSNGTIIGTPSGAWSITSFKDGWYRVTITSTANLSGTGRIWVRALNVAGSPSYTGDGTSGIFIWGAQLEAGAFATSYIPTTSAALTRNADVAVMTGTNFSDWFAGASAGTFQTNFIYPNAKASGGQRFLGFDGFIGFYDTCGYLAFYDGTAQRVFGTMVASNTVKKYAIGFSGTTSSAGKNGTLATDAYSSAAFVPTALYFGRRAGTIAGEINGWIQQVYYWTQRLTDAELQAFSK